MKKEKIPYKKELKVDLLYQGEMVGKYFLDFLIENKIALELKAVPRLDRNDFKQLFAYLKATGLKLGIIANFRTEKLTFKRVLNLNL